MTATQNSGNWQLALDLLIARAALDSTLAEALVNNTIPCCNANGVEIPAGINVVITKPNEEVLVKTIPGMEGSNFESSVNHKNLVGSHSFNQAEETESETVTSQASENETITVGPAVEAELDVVVVMVTT